MEIEEVWAEVLDFPDYEVSNYGYIRNIRLGHDLRPNADSYGYQRVTLSRDGISHYRYLHQLIAQAFLTGWEQSVRIIHLDGDRNNNHILNLRFQGGRRLGRLVRNPKPGVVRRVKNVQLNIMHRNAKDAAKYIGGDLSTVYKVLRGERPSHMGYTFVFVEESQ